MGGRDKRNRGKAERTEREKEIRGWEVGKGEVSRDGGREKGRKRDKGSKRCK